MRVSKREGGFGVILFDIPKITYEVWWSAPLDSSASSVVSHHRRHHWARRGQGAGRCPKIQPIDPHYEPLWYSHRSIYRSWIFFCQIRYKFVYSCKCFSFQPRVFVLCIFFPAWAIVYFDLHSCKLRQETWSVANKSFTRKIFNRPLELSAPLEVCIFLCDSCFSMAVHISCFFLVAKRLVNLHCILLNTIWNEL